ncbi:MAG: hypothetical protein LPJ95_02780 [Paracoccaceae bacterium]|nr:hypothetical protein [Paracoccaceae bacterium]
MIRPLLALLLAAGPAFGAAGTDPDWPCIQRQQPHLSLAQVWSGPAPDEAAEALVRERPIALLAERIEQRRMPLDEAEAAIADFAAEAEPAQLVALMLATFNRIERDRSALMAGISRYGRSQVALAERIEQRRARMEEMEAAETPDFDAIDAEEAALDWDKRIFTERQQQLTYVCETPVILEQRIFALGRAIQSHLD